MAFLIRAPLEAPFRRDAIELWYAEPLHTLETARLVHRALNPLPGRRVKLERGLAERAESIEAKRF